MANAGPFTEDSARRIAAAVRHVEAARGEKAPLGQGLLQAWNITRIVRLASGSSSGDDGSSSGCATYEDGEIIHWDDATCDWVVDAACWIKSPTGLVADQWYQARLNDAVLYSNERRALYIVGAEAGNTTGTCELLLPTWRSHCENGALIEYFYYQLLRFGAGECNVELLGPFYGVQTGCCDCGGSVGTGDIIIIPGPDCCSGTKAATLILDLGTVGDNTCFCSAASGEHLLQVRPGLCEWIGETAGNVIFCSGASYGLVFLFVGDENQQQLGIALRGGGLLATYNRIGSWDCSGEITLDLVQDSLTCAMPATVTVRGA